MEGQADLQELVRRLAGADIEFVVVGGLAVNAWGYLRATADVDVVPASDSENIERLARLLETLDARVQVGDSELGPDSVSIFLRAGDRALVATSLGDLDVLQFHPQFPAWQELREASVPVEIAGVFVRVCSLEHLLEMKRASDRPRDKEDVRALEEANNLPGNG